MINEGAEIDAISHVDRDGATLLRMSLAADDPDRKQAEDENIDELADRMRDYSAGVLDGTQVERRFRQLERAARSDMPGAKLARMADVRYVGQSYELTIPWGASFHEEHQRIYGYADPERPTEIVTVRVHSIIAATKPAPARVSQSVRRVEPELRRVYTGGKFRKVPVFSREQMRARGEKGPALIADYGATTLITAGWSFTVDRVGNLAARR